MPKHLIRKFTPNHKKVKEHKHLRLFGRLLHDPNLFHLNRRSVSGAFFVGLFWTFVPIPFQMIGAAATAILARVNLPISVALVWISNPLTIPPIFYFTYQVGLLLMGQETQAVEFQMSLEWITSVFGQIWQPLWLGSLVVGAIAGILGYALMRGYWRWHVIQHLGKRRRRRLQKEKPVSAADN